MKKACIFVAVLLVLSVLIIPLPACAGRQYKFEGLTSFGVVIKNVDCPIEVTSERLTFNITDYSSVREEKPDYKSNVVAEYSFYNPESYDVNMQLVFPFGVIPYWADVDYIDANKFTVYVDDVKVERGIRAVYCHNDRIFDLERDLSKIVDTRKDFPFLSDDTKVYKYSVKSQFDHNYADAYTPYAQFSTYGLTLFVTSNSYFSNDSSKYDKVTKFYGEDEFIIYSVDKKLPDTFFQPKYRVEVRERVNGNITYTEKKIQGSTSHQYLGEETFEDVILYNYKEESGILRDDYYNAVVDKMDNYPRITDGAYDMKRFDVSRDLMLWYQYDVSVPAGQTVINKVVAPLYPTIDEHYIPTMYHYEYLLSPASSWAAFANLDVTVNTEYFMSEPSLDGFTKNGNCYTAHFDSLPQGELRFSLCASENPDTRGLSGIEVFFIIVGCIILVMLIAIAILCIGLLIPAFVGEHIRKKKCSQLPRNPRVGSKQKDDSESTSTTIVDDESSNSKL